MEAEQRVNWGMAAAGVAVTALGVAMFIALGAGGPAGVVLLGAPVVFAVGVMLMLRGVLPRVALLQQAPLLCVGVVMLLIGGCPWVYTPWLMGDRPGGEAAGMMGTFLFLFAGVPGLIVVLVGLFRLRRQG